MTQKICTTSTNDYEAFSDAHRKLQNVKTFAKLFIFIMISSFIPMVVLPFSSNERKLIVNIAFPVDYKSDRNAFWIAYAFVTGGNFLSMICLFFGLTVWYMLINLVIKFEILGKQFRNICAVKREENGSKVRNLNEQRKLYLQQFIDAIKTHKEINEWMNIFIFMTLYNLYVNFLLFSRVTKHFALTLSNLFLTQIVTSSICICGSVGTLAFVTYKIEYWDEKLHARPGPIYEKIFFTDFRELFFLKCEIAWAMSVIVLMSGQICSK